MTATQFEPKAAQASLFALARERKASDLVSQAEDVYLMIETLGGSDEDKIAVVAPLVLGYLILDDLSPARFALTRLPNNPRSHPLCRVLLELLASTYARHYENIYQRATKVVATVETTGFFSADLANAVKILITTFLESFRRLTSNLLGRSHSSLPTNRAQHYLGLSQSEVIPAVQAMGWVLNEKEGTISLPQAAGDNKALGNGLQMSSLPTLDSLANATAVLELAH